jgi:hypothetical protein
VDEALVAAVHAALGPSREALKAMCARVAALGAELEPALAAWEAVAWTDRAYLYFTRDLTEPVRDLRRLLDGAPAAVKRWQDDVAELTPRATWRLGAGHRATALGLLRTPTLILDAFTRLRGQVADVERQVGRHQGLTPSPRPRAGFVALDRQQIHGRELAKAKTDFDPRRLQP